MSNKTFVIKMMSTRHFGGSTYIITGDFSKWDSGPNYLFLYVDENPNPIFRCDNIEMWYDMESVNVKFAEDEEEDERTRTNR